VSRLLRVAVALALAVCAGSVQAADALTSTPAATSIEAAVPGIKVRHVQPVDVRGGLFEVIDESGNVFYVDGALQVGFRGEMIDVASGRNLSQESLARLRVVDFDMLPLDKAIKHIRGDGSRRVAVFADPDCPFCIKLERELESVENLTTYLFLYPIPELHPAAVERSHRIWCASDPAAAWHGWMLEKREAPEAPAGCQAPLAEIEQLAPGFWIAGTPGMVFVSGRVVPGMVPRDAIEQFLVEAPLAASARTATSPIAP
jgi:thiol:disulfide interchange protein DsbC